MPVPPADQPVSHLSATDHKDPGPVEPRHPGATAGLSVCSTTANPPIDQQTKITGGPQQDHETPRLALKERALARTAPLGTIPGRYRPTDDLLAFLDSL